MIIGLIKLNDNEFEINCKLANEYYAATRRWLSCVT